MATLYASAEAIRREARDLDPLKVLVTLVCLVPFVAFYAARIAWVLISLLWTGGVHGWRTASQHLEARRSPTGGG